jgi:sugar lactone lactonase YvrE
MLHAPVMAHPGSGIVIDRLGQIYFVDMVSGIWKIDTNGALTHISGPAFHWMTLDAGGRFSAAGLPSGASGDVVRLGADPTVILASSYPIAMGRDGNLYFPSHDAGAPVQLLKMLPSGHTSVLSSLPATTVGAPIRDLNGLAAGRDGSLYYTESNAIRRVSREGRVSTVAQNISLAICGSVPGMGPTDRPLLRGLDIDAAGIAYVAATGCGSVLRVTTDGRVSVLFQTEGPWSPTGIALYGNDIYVLEFLGAASDNRREMVPRIRKIAPDGKTRIIATVVRRQVGGITTSGSLLVDHALRNDHSEIRDPNTMYYRLTPIDQFALPASCKVGSMVYEIGYGGLRLEAARHSDEPFNTDGYSMIRSSRFRTATSLALRPSGTVG